MNHKINIGLFGYGAVGESLYHVLKHSKTAVSKICVKQKDKKRSLPKNKLIFNNEDIIDDQEIN